MNRKTPSTLCGSVNQVVRLPPGALCEARPLWAGDSRWCPTKPHETNGKSPAAFRREFSGFPAWHGAMAGAAKKSMRPALDRRLPTEYPAGKRRGSTDVLFFACVGRQAEPPVRKGRGSVTSTFFTLVTSTRGSLLRAAEGSCSTFFTLVTSTRGSSCFVRRWVATQPSSPS